MSYLDKIVWIDDNDDRRGIAEGIGAVFVHLGADNPNIDTTLEEFLAGDKPTIVILDHFLDPPESQIYKRGSTIAEAVKDKWPACPVIGITAADLSGVNERTRDAYDEFFDYTRFKDHLSQIQVIVSGFQTVVGEVPLTQEKVIALLNAPVGETKRLISAMPELLRKSHDDFSGASVVYSWVRHLSDRAGFFFDPLWTATFLGLNEGGFKKVEGKFTGALYTGVFSRSDENRWWATELSSILYAFADPLSGGNTWEVIRGIEGLDKADFSSCHKCGKDFPETVAYEDSQSENRFAMHLECTVLHPGYKRELFFEDIRMMDGE